MTVDNSDSGDFDELLGRAIELQQEGRLDEAAELYDRLWERDPTHPLVVFGGGAVAYQQGRPGDAVPLLRKAILLNPKEAEFHNTLGKALQAQDNWAEAAKCFEAALALDPDIADTHNNFGLCWQRSGNLKRAVEHLRRAAELAPADARIRGNLGLALWHDGAMEQAIESLRTARALDHDDRTILINLMDRLHVLGRSAETDTLIEELAVQARAGPMRAAIAGWGLPVVARSAHDVAARWTRYESAVAALAKGQEIFAQDDLPQGASNFYAAYQNRDAGACQRAIAGFYSRLCPDLNYVAPHLGGERRVEPGAKIRIGFVSAHLFNHTVGKLYRGVIAKLDRARFEVWTFATERRDDEIAGSVEQSSDKYVVLPPSLSAAREVIAAARLDILFYPDIGMVDFTYFLGFSRLAAVQCVGWGHPATTGISTIDYFVSSRDLETPGAEDRYSESLVKFDLPPTHLYRSAPKDRPAPGMPFAEGKRIYGCAQSLFKVHPDFDGILGEVLRRDTEAVAVFIEGMIGWSDILRERWSESIPDVTDRIHFLPRLDQREFFGFLDASTVMLDTVHFTGGMTTVEALELGKPVVTWASTPLMCGRVGAAYYRQMGITDCIAESAEDYVTIAVRLGTDPAYRRDVEARILAAGDRLFQRDEVVREYESFFEQALG